jgi:hypothetical protein
MPAVAGEERCIANEEIKLDESKMLLSRGTL